MAQFENLIKNAAKAGVLFKNAEIARRWMFNRAKGLTPSKLLREGVNDIKSSYIVGSMYFFMYDPKFKDILPYYDTFPLIFPISPTEKGKFLGINMHYLPYWFRAKLMDNLYELQDPRKSNLQISYDILNSYAKYKYFRPCVKYYLKSHMGSPFLKVDPTAWKIALFLPVERFKKKTKEQVFEYSRKVF